MAKLVELILSVGDDHNGRGVAKIFTKEGEPLCEINPMGGAAVGDYDLFRKLLERE